MQRAHKTAAKQADFQMNLSDFSSTYGVIQCQKWLLLQLQMIILSN